MEPWRYCRSTAQRQYHSIITKSVRSSLSASWTICQNLQNGSKMIQMAICVLGHWPNKTQRFMLHLCWRGAAPCLTFSALGKLPNSWLVESSPTVQRKSLAPEQDWNLNKLQWKYVETLKEKWFSAWTVSTCATQFPWICQAYWIGEWNASRSTSRSVPISTKFDYHLLHSTLHFSFHIGSPSPQVPASTEANEHDNDQDETSKPGGCQAKSQPLRLYEQLNSCSGKNKHGGICLCDWQNRNFQLAEVGLDSYSVADISSWF